MRLISLGALVLLLLELFCTGRDVAELRLLRLFIKTTSPDSVVTNDTIEFYLADEFGKWLGNGVGSVFNMPVLYQQNFKFPKKGVYHFDIQHGMRDSLLSGINNVGIKVEKAN